MDLMPMSSAQKDGVIHISVPVGPTFPSMEDHASALASSLH